MDTSYIYVLREAGSNEVRYVGQSQNPIRRFWSYTNGSDIKHLRDANPRKKWLSYVYANGIGLEMEVIEEAGLSIIVQRETHWIAHWLSLGHRLTNVSQPGKTSSFAMGAIRWAGELEHTEPVPMSLIYRHNGVESLGCTDANESQIRQEVSEVRRELSAQRSDIEAIKRVLTLICEKVGVTH